MRRLVTEEEALGDRGLSFFCLFSLPPAVYIDKNRYWRP